MVDPDRPIPSDVAGGGEDEYWPPRVKLDQFDPEAPRSAYELECIIDAWIILQRSAVDAAALPASERNIFAFSEACIYFATVHDADFETREARRKKKDKENKEEEKGERPEGNAEAKVERPGLFPDYMQRLENYFQGILDDAAVSNTHDALASDERDDGMHPFVRHLAPEDRDAGDLCPEANTTEPLHEQEMQIDTQNLAISSGIGDEALTNTVDANQQVSFTSSTTHGDLYDAYGRNGPFEFPPAAVPDQYTESAPKVNPKMPKSDFIGIVYLVPTPGPAQEVSIGLALLPHARGQGFGSVTIKRVLATAFDEFTLHRVSAGVLGPSPNIIARRPLVGMTKTPGGDNAVAKGSAASRPDVEARLKVSGTETDTEAGLRMFVGLGFSLEGTRRRAVPDMHDNGSWRDAHYLAMLDTDWLAQQRAALAAFVIDQAQSKSKGKGKSTSMVSDSDDVPESRNGNSKAERARDAWKDQRRTRWDEMLTRHQREQETLARVEARLQRSASVETLRPTGGRDELVEAEIGFGSMTDGTTSGYSSSAAGDGELEGKRIGEETERDSFTVASPPPRSSTSTSAYSLSDPAEDFDMARHRTSGAGDGSRYFSDDGSESEVDYGEETVQSKVLRFLEVRPPPGTPPPPSDVEDDSDFESCMDDLDILSDREMSATPGTEMVHRSVGENVKVNGEANENAMGPLATSLNSVAALNLRKKQSRKRRRLSNDLVAVEDSGHVEADDASPSGSSPPRLPYTGSDSRTFALVRSGMDLTFAETSQLHTTSRARTQGGSPNSEFQFVDADPDMDMDSHSDAETAYTVSSTSTWEVVSDGRAASARIPTPLTSLRALSSGTGLSSLKGTSASEDE